MAEGRRSGWGYSRPRDGEKLTPELGPALFVAIKATREWVLRAQCEGATLVVSHCEEIPNRKQLFCEKGSAIAHSVGVGLIHGGGSGSRLRGYWLTCGQFRKQRPGRKQGHAIDLKDHLQ